MSKEYYNILWISENATAEEIKKAYRKKAMECHPDRCAGDKTKEAEFKKVNEAYSVLSDPQKKANYDRFGSAEWMWWFGGGFNWFGWGFGGGFNAEDLGDIFSQFFGGEFGGQTSRRRNRADIWEDIEIRMKISLEDAIKWVSRKIEYNKNSTCQTCNWKWWERTTCSKCHGSGQIRERIQTVFGAMEQTRTCDNCRWEWTTITEACSTCNWSGKTTEKITKTIEVPKWIEDTMTIKMRWEWHSGRDGNWDLYITFSIPNEEWGLIRKGADLHYKAKISPAEAVLWNKKTINIPILWKKEIIIGKWTQYGEEIIFRWEWMEKIDGWKPGNLVIHLIIETPNRLSEDQKKLYEAILKSEWWKPQKWWLEEFFGK